MEYRELSRVFREIADVADELAGLEEREKNGENVETETATALGKFMLLYMELQK